MQFDILMAILVMFENFKRKRLNVLVKFNELLDF